MKLNEQIQKIQPNLLKGDFETDAEWIAYVFGFASARTEAARIVESREKDSEILVETNQKETQ